MFTNTDFMSEYKYVGDDPKLFGVVAKGRYSGKNFFVSLPGSDDWLIAHRPHWEDISDRPEGNPRPALALPVDEKKLEEALPHLHEDVKSFAIYCENMGVHVSHLLADFVQAMEGRESGPDVLIRFTPWERWHLIDHVNRDMLKLQDKLIAEGKSIQRYDTYQANPRLSFLADKLLWKVAPRSTTEEKGNPCST